ncbi:MAG: HAMP domain-containing sensor histidine kinase [Elusimicrobia bacterium]|nr:HAMP domain-containing sensor histidine kinase [Elusimicrobiota bacterium]
MARTAILLGAAAVTLVPAQSRPAVLLFLEILASMSILALVLRRRRRRHPALLVTAASLFAGDIFYFLDHNVPGVSSWLFPFEEGAYTVYILAAAVFLVHAYRAEPRRSVPEKWVLLMFFTGFAYLSGRYVLIPFFRSGNFPSPFFYFTSSLYRITEAGVVALALLLGMKASSRRWFLMANGIALLSIASIALGYNTGVINATAIPFQEFGWLWGLLMILASQTYPDQEKENFSRWESARVRLVWLVFLFNAALLLLLYFLQNLVSKDAFQLTSLMFIAFASWLGANILSFKISEDLNLLLENLQEGGGSAASYRPRVKIHEAEVFAERLRIAYETIRTQSQMAALAKLSAQVAHDIRSPLAALDSALKDISSLPENKRLLIRGAAARIRDIANNLLEKKRQSGTASSPGARRAEPLLLSSLIESVITEKRLQYRDRPEVLIESSLGPDSYGLFVAVDPVEFGRVVSNLVNNAVEALDNGGSVAVHLSQTGNSAEVAVRDDGKGIPPDILPRLGRMGETHGKEGGTGLGLYHARTTAEAWGGKLSISSRPKGGTEVTIALPLSRPPGWFLPALRLDPGSSIVVLDDDTSIHQVWKGRFDSLRLRERGISLYSFSAPAALRDWKESNPSLSDSAVYLLDYELLGHQDTGLTLAEELRISDRASLVTSRYDEAHIVEGCRKLGMRLVPKNLSGLLPVTIHRAAARPEGPVLLLDDDPLVHASWRISAKAAGAEFRGFSDPAAFIAAAEGCGKDVVLYVDSELGGGLHGEKIAERLHDKGYSDISLATGHPPEKFAHLPWLRITGKAPPWTEDTSA